MELIMINQVQPIEAAFSTDCRREAILMQSLAEYCPSQWSVCPQPGKILKSQVAGERTPALRDNFRIRKTYGKIRSH